MFDRLAVGRIELVERDIERKIELDLVVDTVVDMERRRRLVVVAIEALVVEVGS